MPDKIYSMLWCALLLLPHKTKEGVGGGNKLSLKLSWIALMLDWLSTEIQTKNLSNRFQGIAKNVKSFFFMYKWDENTFKCALESVFVNKQKEKNGFWGNLMADGKEIMSRNAFVLPKGKKFVSFVPNWVVFVQ